MSKNGVTYLDTSGFDNAITAFRDGITEYNAIRSNVKWTTLRLFEEWQGEGKMQFEKNYNTLYMQLSDIADVMYELYNTLAESEAAYIKADEETAKMLQM